MTSERDADDAPAQRSFDAVVELYERVAQKAAATIHDDTLQVLNAVALRLDLVAFDLEGESKAAVATAIDQVREGARRLAALEMALRPPALHEGDLASAIGDAASTTAAGGHVSIAPGTDATLPPPRALLLFRAVQHLIEHAAAAGTATEITLEVDGDDLVIDAVIDEAAELTDAVERRVRAAASVAGATVDSTGRGVTLRLPARARG